MRLSVAVLCSLACLSLPATAQAPPEGPLLDWSLLGYLADHHVGSSNYGHFGIRCVSPPPDSCRRMLTATYRLRNAGVSGDLQVSLFVSSAQSRFWVARPRDLVLAPGAQEVHSHRPGVST